MYKKKFDNSYKSASLETASPGKIILMLYDGALKYIDLALNGFESNSCRETNEKVNNNILRSLAIIAELKACLDHNSGGDFAKTMSALYDYMEMCLAQGNMKKDKEPINEARKHLQGIRDTWAEMLTKQGDPDVATASISCSA